MSTCLCRRTHTCFRPAVSPPRIYNSRCPLHWTHTSHQDTIYTRPTRMSAYTLLRRTPRKGAHSGPCSPRCRHMQRRWCFQGLARCCFSGMSCMSWPRRRSSMCQRCSSCTMWCSGTVCTSQYCNSDRHCRVYPYTHCCIDTRQQRCIRCTKTRNSADMWSTYHRSDPNTRRCIYTRQQRCIHRTKPRYSADMLRTYHRSDLENQHYIYTDSERCIHCMTHLKTRDTLSTLHCLL